MKRLLIILLVISVAFSGNCQKLFKIYENQNLIEFKKKISKKPELMYERDENGLTILHQAVYDGSYEYVKTLLDNGMDINTTDESGFSCLIYSALKGDADMVEFLISKYASVNFKSVNNLTPLMCAAMSGSFITAKKLIDAGADVNACGTNGRNSLMLTQDLAVAELLVNNKININEQDEEGNTVLHFYSGLNWTDESFPIENKKLVEFIIGKGADVNIANNNGFLPIHYACRQNFESVTEILIQSKSQIDARTKTYLLTPLYMAAYNNRIGIVKILLKYNADKTLKTNEGETPYDIAVKQGFTEIAELLK